MKTIPDDFPRPLGSVGGAQAKLSALLVDGHFVEGMPEDELAARYEASEDLAAQLVSYSQRKRVQFADLSLKEFLRRVRDGVVHKRWDLEHAELQWVMQRVAVAMGGSPADVPGLEVTVEGAAEQLATHRVTPPPVPSVVDLALAQGNVRAPCRD